MSDENQPNEVVESQPSQELLAADAAPSSAVETESVQDTVELQAEALETAVSEPEPAPSAVPPEDAPSVVSIADIDAKPRRGAGLAGGGGGLSSLLSGRGWLVGVIVAILLIVFLLLPPISLAQRLSAGRGYSSLTAETPSVSHPDGLLVQRAADAEGVTKLKLGSIPRADFLAGTLPEEAAGSLAALPSYLEPKSPYYTLSVRGKVSPSGSLSVVIPNESEPWETLDLYTWDGQAWRWIPSRLDRATETLVADVASLPSSLMVMQSGVGQQIVALSASELPGADVAALVDQVDVPGLLIGTLGGVNGDVTALPGPAAGGDLDLAPVIRNWVPDRDPSPALVSDMLSEEADRTAHVTNILGLVQTGGYPGVVIDYRGVPPQDRAAFAQFVTDLSTAFHAADLWVAVMVDTPQQTAEGGWDTGGYDWAALGAAADQVRVMMPLSPEAYAADGRAEQMVQWAAGQVERHRLMLMVSTLSTDGSTKLAVQDVVASVGKLALTETITESVQPGTTLNFALSPQVSVEVDGVTGATRMQVGETQAWLGTPQWLRARMDLAARYHLGGIVLHDLLDEGNVANVGTAVADYRSQVATTAAPDLPNVLWTVTAAGAESSRLETPLSQPQFVWTAPTVTGTYRIAASLAGADKGAIDVVVALPAPVVTETVATGEDEPEAGDVSAATTALPAAQELKASFAGDVSVPDNTHFEKGEQFTKTWRLKNTGSKDWPADTVLAFSSGEQMAQVSEVEVGLVKAGAEVEISVEMTAPDKDGSFKSWWTLKTGGKEIPGGKIYVVIAAGEQPVAAPIAVPVAGPGPTGSFELGGHVRDLGLPFQDKMHYAGMNWAKVQVRYGEGAAGVINAAHAAGFKIQLSALGAASMVTQPGFEASFAQWVAGLAASGADAIEVWNEPNIGREWQIGSISPQSYTNLLCASYRAIKAANAGTAVISAAPSPTGWFGGGCTGDGCDDQPWMEGLYQAGAAACMDYLGAHHNQGATSPSATIGHPNAPSDPHHSYFYMVQNRLYYSIFHGTRQLFYTELGYASQEGVPEFSDDFKWARGTDNAEQAAWLAEAVQLSIGSGMVRCIIVWNIDFVRYGYDPQDGFAIIRPGGGCPACESLHNVLGTR